MVTASAATMQNWERAGMPLRDPERASMQAELEVDVEVGEWAGSKRHHTSTNYSRERADRQREYLGGRGRRDTRADLRQRTG